MSYPECSRALCCGLALWGTSVSAVPSSDRQGPKNGLPNALAEQNPVILMKGLPFQVSLSLPRCRSLRQPKFCCFPLRIFSVRIACPQTLVQARSDVCSLWYAV